MTVLERIARAANPNWGTMSRNDRRNALITARAYVFAMADILDEATRPRLEAIATEHDDMLDLRKAAS